MTIFQWLTSITLTATTFAALHAEPHCPGNVTSLRLRLVQHSMSVIPVEINHTGPYDFLLDTGTQVTIIDPSLAEELHLTNQGAIDVVGVGFLTHATLAQPEILEVGSKTMADPVVVVQNLDAWRKAGFHIHGILGGNFLEHFDVLIDYGQNILCLDDTNVMGPAIKGEHIALLTPPHDADEKHLPHPLIPVHLSDVRTRQFLMTLDSGTNVPFLYKIDRDLAPRSLAGTWMQGRSGDGAEQRLFPLPPQNMKIGNMGFREIRFVTLASAERDGPKWSRMAYCRRASSGVSTSVTPVALPCLNRGKDKSRRLSFIGRFGDRIRNRES
jgi:hypothetical protein